MIELEGGVVYRSIGWNDFVSIVLHLFYKIRVLLFLKLVKDDVIYKDVFTKHFGFDNVGGGWISAVVIDDVREILKTKVDTHVLMVHAEQGQGGAVIFCEPKVEWDDEINHLLGVAFI